MELQDALRRIQKCLALSKSSNEHEAGRALAQAQKLMKEYNVSPEQVGMLVIEEHSAKSVACTKPPEWEVWLAFYIGKAFGCRSIHTMGWFDSQRNRDGAKGEYTYIGPKAQAMTAAWTMDMLRTKVFNGRSAYTTQLREEGWGLKDRMDKGNAWAEAFVYEMSKKIEDFANPADTEQAMADAQRARTGGKTFNNEHVTKRDKGAPEDYVAGAREGYKTHIHRPIA